MGADIVGIAPRTRPSCTRATATCRTARPTTNISKSARGAGAASSRTSIVATTAWDYDTLQAHRHHIGDAVYHVSQMKANMILKASRATSGAGLHGAPRCGEPPGRGAGRRRGRAGPQRHGHQREVRRAHPHARPDHDRPAAGRRRADRHRRRGLLQDLPQVRQSPARRTASSSTTRSSTTASRSTRSTG